MKDFLKKNAITFSIIGGTVILAGIAIFTAVRLYQLRQTPVAPSVPESEPAATGGINYEDTACSALTFTLTTQTPTPTPTATPTSTPTATPTSSPTPTPSPGTSSTPTPAGTPLAELPSAGVATPTILGFGLGALLIMAAIALLML